MPNKVLFIAPYPYDRAPSQRFRFEQYFQYLDAEGISWRVAPFWSERGWRVLYTRGRYLRKLLALLSGFIRRIGLLFELHRYDRILLHREATPIGPPFFEWMLSRVLQRRFCYDFDDAIWMPNTSEENKLAAGLKQHSKVPRICAWASCVSCGNAWLEDYARRHNSRTLVMPTTIDTDYHVPPSRQSGTTLTIGWTGTHSTARYLETIRPVLRKIGEEVSITFLVISNQPPKQPDRFWRYARWDRAVEIQQLQQIDIGVMPLADREWEKGKCGFKALQYMALGIPAVVSPVGVNKEIIRHGHSGFHCSTAQDWYDTLMELVRNPELRKTIGTAGRDRVQKLYSAAANKERFLDLLCSC